MRRLDRRGRAVRLGLALALAAALPTMARAQGDFPSEFKSIAAVRLKGRHRVPAKEIWAVLKTRRPSLLPWRQPPAVRRDFLLADARAIEAVYRQHGFLDAQADYNLSPAPDPRATVVTFTILEGQRSKVAAVELNGVQSVPVSALRKKLLVRPGRPFNPAFLIVDTLMISATLNDRGRLPRVTGAWTRDSLRVSVRYEVDEGPLFRNGAVVLSHSDSVHVRDELVRRELLLKPGDVYRASRVRRSLERLYETGLFSQVRIAPLVDSTRTRVDFDLRVRERRRRWIDAGVGSGTAERFRFTGEWGNRNIAGRGLQGVLSSKLALDGRGRFLLARAEGSLLEPWLLRSRTRGLATVYDENRHDRADPRWVVEQEGRGVSFQLRRDLGRYGHVALTQDNAFVIQDISLIDPAYALAVPDSLKATRYTTHRLQLGGDRDTRDDPVNPGHGSAQSLSGEVAGGPLRGTSSFIKGQFQSSWYTPARGTWVIATRVRAGAIDPFGRKRTFSPDTTLDPEVTRVPLEDRFRIGGVNSLRGYNESEVPLSGGLAVIQANAELRVPVVGPFGLEFFLDAGNVWARPTYVKGRDFIPRPGSRRLDPGDVRYVFGGGARVNLPFGPLRIDFTWSPRPDERGRWLVAEPQFAIGPSF